MRNIFILIFLLHFSSLIFVSFFRELVCKNKPLYDKNQCEEYRRSLAMEIVNELLPGRFIKIELGAKYGRVLDYSKSVTKVSRYLCLVSWNNQSNMHEDL